MIKRYPEIANWKPKSVSPPGLTWHHHEDVCRLTLVDRTDHLKNHAFYHPFWMLTLVCQFQGVIEGNTV